MATASIPETISSGPVPPLMYQASSNASDSARLEDYIRAVRLRKWLVLAAALAGLALALALASARTPMYSASSSVLLGPTPVGAVNTNLVNPNLEKEREIILSNRTAADAASIIAFTGESEDLLAEVDVAFRPDSDVITVEHVSADAVEAASVANGFATAYSERREGDAIAYYQTAIDTSQLQLDSITAELEELEQLQSDLTIERRSIVAEPAGPERDNSIATVDASLTETRTAIANLRVSARGFENSIRLDTSSLATRAPSAEVLRSAIPATDANGLSQNLFGLGGLLLGLILGVVSAFLLDRLDTTARDDDDVALALGTKVIGAIPTFGVGNRSGASALIMLSQGGSSRLAAGRESFRRLRSSLQFLRSNDGVKTVIVTSASPAEGKSVTSANLAISLAQSGSRVALVSADLRRPTQEDLFGIAPSSDGLSGYLGRGTELRAQQVDAIPNLFIVDAGPAPANPGELLGSPRFQSLVEELDSEVDFAIIDTPPILSTADALAAGTFVDGIIIVVDTRRTETTELLQVRSDLERSGARILGAVMNRRRFKRGSLFNRRKYSYYRTERSSATEIVEPEQAA